MGGGDWTPPLTIESKFFEPRLPPSGLKLAKSGLPIAGADGRLLYTKGGEWLATAPATAGQLAWYDGSDWTFTPTPTAGQIAVFDGANWTLVAAPTAPGQSLRWDGSAWLPAFTGGQLLWGDGALGTGTNDRYPSPGYDMGTGASTTIIEFRVTRNCRTQGLYFIGQTHVGGADAELTATVLRNGAPSAHSLVIPPATLSAQDIVTVQDWTAGDRCSLLCTRADPSNPGDYTFTLGLN